MHAKKSIRLFSKERKIYQLLGSSDEMHATTIFFLSDEDVHQVRGVQVREFGAGCHA
jgi:hypothetical protein